MASSAAALCIAPACTVSSGSDDTEGGAGGDGNTSTGGTSTGGTSTGGTSTGGAPAGGALGEGGDAGATTGGVGGETAGGAAGDSGAGGAGGASGKVCTNPMADEISAKGDTCAVYCSSYLSTCAAFNTTDQTFEDEADCLTRCEFFDDAQLCCRAYHVRNAAASASAATTHCTHAAGNSVCN